MKKIILASTSPRRYQILKKLCFDFEVIKPDFDENISNKPFSYNIIETTALNKGLSVVKYVENNSIIISADTVVIYNNIILGKPNDFNEAFKTLKILSNNTHKVITSVCVIDNETGIRNIQSETSKVTFSEIPSEEIKNYINNFKPYDKAGSYGIQELKKSFVKNINGEYDNIVGLPSKLVLKMLNEIS